MFTFLLKNYYPMMRVCSQLTWLQIAGHLMEDGLCVFWLDNEHTFYMDAQV